MSRANTVLADLKDVLASASVSTPGDVPAARKRTGSESGEAPMHPKRSKNTVPETSKPELLNDNDDLSDLSSLTDSDSENDDKIDANKSKTRRSSPHDGNVVSGKDDADHSEDEDSDDSAEWSRAADQAMYEFKKSRQGSVLIEGFQEHWRARRRREQEELDLERRKAEAEAEFDALERDSTWGLAEAEVFHRERQKRRKGWKKTKAQKMGTLFPSVGSRFVYTDYDFFHADCGSGTYRYKGPRK